MKQVSFDKVFDAALTHIGIQPRAVAKFLSSHKAEVRIAANAVSLSRVVLGYVAVESYEKAKNKKNTQQMAAAMVVIAFVLSTDALDGYITRKARISGSKTGRLLDSAADVALRFMLAKSSLSNKDTLDTIRGIGELLVATSAFQDIAKGTYASTNLGKIKVGSDAVVIVAGLLNDFSKQKSTMSTSLKLLQDAARSISIGLAWADGVQRMTKKSK